MIIDNPTLNIFALGNIAFLFKAAYTVIAILYFFFWFVCAVQYRVVNDGTGIVLLNFHPGYLWCHG